MLHVCDADFRDDSVSLRLGGVLNICGIVKWVPECVAADVWLLSVFVVTDVFLSAKVDRELSPEAVSSPGEAHGGC